MTSLRAADDADGTALFVALQRDAQVDEDLGAVLAADADLRRLGDAAGAQLSTSYSTLGRLVLGEIETVTDWPMISAAV